MLFRVVGTALLIAGCSSDPTHAEKMIGAEGGVVMLGDALLVIPMGAMSSSSLITIDIADDSPATDVALESPIYRFGPDGTTFTQPITFSVPYAGTSDQVAMLWTDDTGQFVPVPTTIIDNIATAQSMHFSWGLLGKIGQAIVDEYEASKWCTTETCKATDTTQYCVFYKVGDRGKPCAKPFDCASRIVTVSGKCFTPWTCIQTTTDVTTCEMNHCTEFTDGTAKCGIFPDGTPIGG